MRCSSDCAAASVVTRTRIDDKSSPIRMSQRTGGQPSSHRWYVMRKQDSGSSHEGEMKMIRSAFTRRVLVAALATAAAGWNAGGWAQSSEPPPGQELEKVEMLLDWKALPTYAGFFLAKE